jgi:putative GTP pyrophosphokinase
VSGPSKTQVDKAGVLLRKFAFDPRRDDIDQEKLTDAVGVVWAHRNSFAYPMLKVNANLRYYVKKFDQPPTVAQRHKRLPRIVVKLLRHERMRLSQMQDVGGCRAILPNQAAVDGVLLGLKRNWDIVTTDDYVASPRSSGYRAVHVIVKRDGVPIEVQLRTPGQQSWADEVERLDSRFLESVKDGEGPPFLIDYLRRLADLINAIDRGDQVDPAEREAVSRIAVKLELDINGYHEGKLF